MVNTVKVTNDVIVITKQTISRSMNATITDNKYSTQIYKWSWAFFSLSHLLHTYVSLWVWKKPCKGISPLVLSLTDKLDNNYDLCYSDVTCYIIKLHMVICNGKLCTYRY